ncbi:MAG: hypothetical protein ACTHKG_11710 [Nocardioides sp.]
MRKLIAFAALGLAATSMSIGPAQAAQPEMVTVCQVSGQANSPDSDNVFTWFVGHEITVPQNAYDHGFAHQGDGLLSDFKPNYYITPAHNYWKTLADKDGSLTNADCAFHY